MLRLRDLLLLGVIGLFSILSQAHETQSQNESPISSEELEHMAVEFDESQIKNFSASASLRALVQEVVRKELSFVPNHLRPKKIKVIWIDDCKKSRGSYTCDYKTKSCLGEVEICPPPHEKNLEGWKGIFYHEAGHILWYLAQEGLPDQWEKNMKNKCLKAGNPWQCVENFGLVVTALDELFADTYSVLVDMNKNIVDMQSKYHTSPMLRVRQGLSQRSFAKDRHSVLFVNDHNYYSQLRPELFSIMEKTPKGRFLEAMIISLKKEIDNISTCPEWKFDRSKLNKSFLETLENTLSKFK